MALTIEQAIKDGWTETEAPRFVAFMKGVDAYLIKHTGGGVFDSEDWRWADAFTAGMTPQGAARDFMEEIYGREFP